jgi:hypothetical protein
MVLMLSGNSMELLWWCKPMALGYIPVIMDDLLGEQTGALVKAFW